MGLGVREEWIAVRGTAALKACDGNMIQDTSIASRWEGRVNGECGEASGGGPVQGGACWWMEARRYLIVRYAVRSFVWRQRPLRLVPSCFQQAHVSWWNAVPQIEEIIFSSLSLCERCVGRYVQPLKSHPRSQGGQRCNGILLDDYCGSHLTARWQAQDATIILCFQHCRNVSCYFQLLW